MEVLKSIAENAGYILQIATCLAFLIKPIRERIIGMGQISDGQRCLLRSDIVRLYYRHKEDCQLREYEFQNLEQCYKAYKALGGNSFVDHIYEEMQDWSII